MEEKNKKSILKKILRVFSIFASLLVGFIIIFLVISFSSRFVRQKIEDKPKAVEVKSCTRTKPNKMDPEFERGISIVKQKMVPEGFLDNIENCLNVDYDQLKKESDGPEGVFMFDSSVSSFNNLKISVDNSYKSEDDYLTAILLVHEITHAKQFYEKQDLSCIDREVHAFWNEFVLLTKLNEGEKYAITARLYDPTKKSLSAPLQGIDNIIEAVKVPYYGKCKQDMECTQRESAQLLRKLIEGTPAYQKLCK